jgi:hypothetical protein
MIPTMQPESNPNGGDGMSRAAKKRAKKKQKTNEPQMMIPPAESTDEQETTKKRVVTQASTGQDDGPGISKKARLENHAKTETHDDEDSNGDDEDGKVSGAVPAASRRKSPPVPECSFLRQIVQPENNPSIMAMTTKERATASLGYLLGPSGISVAEFYNKYCEKQPVCVKDDTPEHRHRFDVLRS